MQLSVGNVAFIVIYRGRKYLCSGWSHACGALCGLVACDDLMYAVIDKILGEEKPSVHS